MAHEGERYSERGEREREREREREKLESDEMRESALERKGREKSQEMRVCSA